MRRQSHTASTKQWSGFQHGYNFASKQNYGKQVDDILLQLPYLFSKFRRHLQLWLWHLNCFTDANTKIKELLGCAALHIAYYKNQLVQNCVARDWTTYHRYVWCTFGHVIGMKSTLHSYNRWSQASLLTLWHSDHAAITQNMYRCQTPKIWSQ